MEKKHIDKIAAVREPDRREGSPSPGALGAEPQAGGMGGTESPLVETGPQYEAKRSTGREGPVSGGPGVLYTSGGSSIDMGFIQRNRILQEDWNMLPVTSPEEYFRILFSRPDSLDREVNFMQATGRTFWGDHHYNAIAYNLIPVQVVDKKTGELVWKERAEKIDITRELSECVKLKGPSIHKVISSPILYAGRTRKKERARSIWGIAVDLDDVGPDNLRSMRMWIDKLDYIPEPSMIVSSGGGLHIYYLFPKGVGTQSSTEKALQRLKHNMTKKLWNDLFSSNPDPDLHQGIWQGYRVPGTPTKTADVNVIGFTPIDIPYYTVRELNKYFQPEFGELIQRDNKPLTEAEIEAVDNSKYLPSEISFKEAKELWPDWDPSKEAGQWTANRKLYDWWLNKVIRGGQAFKKDFKGTVPLAVGRRFYWMLSLVAFAKKCGISYDELESDAYSLLDMFDSLSVSDDNRFTAVDIEAALKLYKLSGKQSAARFKKTYIGAKTHFHFKETKRNGRTREENLIIARTARDVNDRKYGREWDQYNGRKNAERRVQMWCWDHPYSCSKTDCAKELNLDTHTVAKWWWKENPLTIPEAVLLWKSKHPGIENKSLCARECSIDVKTARKWWNCTAEDAKAEFDRLNAIQKAGLAAINAKKSVGEYEIPDIQPSELHDMGAEVNYGYITDRKIAAATMQNTEGYEAQDAATIHKTGDELTDAINFGALNVEELMRSMGVPDFMIPMMKAEIERQMQTPEFWEQYKKARPETDMSDWPPEARKAYEAAVKDHNKK